MDPTKKAIILKNLSIEYTVSRYSYNSFKEWILQKRKHDQSYQVVKALKDINITINQGESVALIGHNGCGKSTLLKVIAGVIIAKHAEVKTHGTIAPLIELGAGFDGELSGIENIYLSCTLMGLSKKDIDKKLESIIEFSELNNFISMPLKNYSSGMYARLGFACATAINPNILLIDEVLAVGDANFSKKCLSRINDLQKNGTTIVLVTHDMNAVKDFCSRAIVLYEGQLKYDGDVQEAILQQTELMDQRFLNTLPKNEREEILRVRKLKSEKKQITDNLNEVRSNFKIEQMGQIVTTLDASIPFTIEVTLSFSKPHLLKENISVGLGLFTQSDLRIGGFNNIQLNEPFPFSKIEKDKLITVQFVFSQGIPDLSAGSYNFKLGIHDKSLTRTVLLKDLGSLKIKNKKLGPNEDNDILSIHNHVHSINFDFPKH